MRVTHLRHHGQCLSDNDPEGAPAKWQLRQVFMNGPYHIFTLRIASLQMAPHTKKKQLIETAINLLVVVVFTVLYLVGGNSIGLVYWAVAFIMSSLMPLWASYIPHKVTMRSRVRLWGVKLATFWTPIVSSFAFHHFHHTYPKVPTALLPKAAAELPEPEEHDHSY